MKKKVIAMLLAVALILSCMPQVAVALESNSVSYRYCDESGQNWQIGTTNSYSPVLSDTTELTTGWYVVTGTVACQNTLSVSGEVNLILTDDSSLTAAQGIQLNNSAKLSIYAQEKQNGVLISQGVGSSAGLGVCESAELVIYGGAITATGSAEGVGAGAGIGGNYSTAAGTIIIHAGEINATGASEAYGGAAGIGGGGQSSHAKKVVITGGNITAIGGQNGAAGIGGGGHDGELRSFAISGGWVNATGFKAPDGRGTAHAIGGGMSKTAADLSGATNAMVLDGSTKIATYYGDSLARDMVIPEGYTMYIAKGRSLTIPDGVALTNNGTIVVCGTLNSVGTLSGSGTVTQHRFTNATTCDFCGANFTGEITEVVVKIDSPKGEQPFPTNAVSTTPAVSVVSVKWTADDESGEALSGNAEYFPWVYKAYITLQADADYYFSNDVGAQCDGFHSSQLNDDGTLTVVIRRWSNQTPLESITNPDSVTGVQNGTNDLASYLPNNVTVKTGSENINSAGVTWDVANCNYDKTLVTEQTFTVKGTLNLPEEVSNPDNVPLTVEIIVTVSASELIDYDVVDTSPGGTTHIQVVGDHHNLSVDVQKDGNSTDKDVQYQWYKMTDVSITNENASTVTDHGYYYSSYNAATGMWTAQRYNEGEAEITSMYFKTNFSAGDILTVKISTDIDGTLCLVGPQNLSAQYDSATCTYVFNVSVDGEYTLQLEDDYSFSNPQVIANVYECAAIAGAAEKDYTIPASDAKMVGTNKYIIKATSGNWSEELEIVVNVAGPSYTVTIPATATVNEVLTISADVELLRAKDVLNVYVSATSGTNNAFTLTNAEGVELGYELKNGDTIIGVNDKILSVASGEEESVDLSIVPDEAKYSGNYTGTITFTIAIKSVQELNFADGKIHIYPTGYKQGNASEITPFVGEYIITGSIDGDTPLKIVNDTDAPASYSITLDNAAIVGSAWCTAFLVNSPDAPVVVNLKSTGNCEIRTSENHQPIKAETPNVTINYELIDGSLYLRGPYSGDGQGVYNEYITFNSSCGIVNAADQSVRLEHTIENGTCTSCGATVTG